VGAILAAVFGVAFFGLTSLVLAWFEDVEGVAGPVTDLGYGVLVGIILSTGLLVQLRRPEWKIAGVEQAFLVIPALVLGSAIASDSQNLVPAMIMLPAVGILLALHPAREEFFRRGAASDQPSSVGKRRSSDAVSFWLTKSLARHGSGHGEARIHGSGARLPDAPRFHQYLTG